MKNNEAIYPVKKMAEMFEIPRSQYYTWLNSKPCSHELRDQELLVMKKRVMRTAGKFMVAPGSLKILRSRGLKPQRNE